MYRIFLSVLLALALGGCAGVDDPTKDWAPERFYQEAKDKLAEGDYAAAIKYFEQLEARYPYGRHSEQAQLEIAYAYYKDEEPALALAAADRFIRQHPTHAHVDYAYYLKGIINFRGNTGFFNWLLGAKDDPSDHDPKSAQESFEAFRELTERFPNSRYAADARQRMAYLFEAQARAEIKVARFYYDRRAYVAAINRCKHTLENFPRTPSIEDALGLQALAYRQLGMDTLHRDTVRILRMNFPNSRYFDELAQLSAS